MDDKTYLSIIGLMCMTVLESIALLKEVDGQMFSLVIGALGFIVGGTTVAKVLRIKKEEY